LRAVSTKGIRIESGIRSVIERYSSSRSKTDYNVHAVSQVPPKTGEISGGRGYIRPQRDPPRAGGSGGAEAPRAVKDKGNPSSTSNSDLILTIMAKGIRVSRFSRIFSTQSALGRQPPEPKEPKKLKELAGPAESKPKTPTSPVVVPGKLKNTTPIGPRHDYKLFTLGVEELTVECAIDRADLPPGEMYQLPDCDCLICDTCLES
jgi:hypothetical protein